VLLENENADLSTVDKCENSIYHIATIFDNGEALKHILDSFTNDKIFSKNHADETILHCACRIGNVAMVKQILNKMYETEGSLESFLLQRNKDGETCFHICFSNGYSNIVEYFLKEKKLNIFLEILDNNSNTALHLATMNGHSSIVKCLIEHGADVDVKNEDDISPLDFSCRKGFFEISKNIIASQEEKKKENDQLEPIDTNNVYPLHVACYEGAHEVVKLLLLKGV
jgi:ankyrin repeat protein